MTPMLAFFHDPWVAGAAFICLGLLYFGALIRSQSKEPEETY